MSSVIYALFLGITAAFVVEWLSFRERHLLELPPLTRRQHGLRAVIVASAAILFILAFEWASLVERCLDTPEVMPSAAGHQGRFAYLAALIALLIAATGIDFDCYMIPDAITVTGTIIGITGACCIQQAQLCHLWVDWSVAIPQLRGPLIPTWYVSNPFWHALAWSLSGTITGASLTWLARQISSLVLGQEAMGFGDVMLMGMIGSFLGWQAVTLVFLIAPLAGLTIGVLVRMLTGKTYLPYGPWLSIAAVAVLFGWKHLWLHTRLIFSDWISVMLLGVIGGVSFVALLWLLQLYKSIPTRPRSQPES